MYLAAFLSPCHDRNAAGQWDLNKSYVQCREAAGGASVGVRHRAERWRNVAAV